MICQLVCETGAEIIANKEILERYPKTVQNVATGIVALFGEDKDYEEHPMYVGFSFKPDLVAELLDQGDFEFNRFRMCPIPRKDGKPSTEYNVTCDTYPMEGVHVFNRGPVLEIQHRINRLDY